MRISDADVEHFRRHGYLIVERFLDEAEVAAARTEIHRIVPTWEELDADRSRFPWAPGAMAFEEFPFASDVLNLTSVHPELDSFLQRVTGRTDLFLTQSLLWSKYASDEVDFDQSFHMDFDDNSLLVPDPADAYPQIAFILYYSDVTEDLGPTKVVSREHSGGRPLWPHMRSREEDPALYEHEVAAVVPAGSLLAFSMATYHRGTAFRTTSGARFAQHIVYRTAGAEWQGWRAFPRYARTPEMERFMATATPRQRELIGVPPPGHPYWSEATVAGVALRYPGMDLTPYATA